MDTTRGKVTRPEGKALGKSPEVLRRAKQSEPRTSVADRGERSEAERIPTERSEVKGGDPNERSGSRSGSGRKVFPLACTSALMNAGS